jgi:predicted CoA-binding protein
MTSEPFWSPDDETVRRLLERVRRIAVVGLSPKTHRDSNRVARYLLERGYTVVPVYPRENEILGQTVYRTVRDIPEKVDLVDVFRRSSEVGRAMDDALAAGAPAIWTQLDCVDEEAARRAHAAGAVIVMDRCLMVEHARLLGRSWQAV